MRDATAAWAWAACARRVKDHAIEERRLRGEEKQAKLDRSREAEPTERQS